MSKAKKRFIDANALKKAIDHTGVDMLESADYFGFTYKKIMRVIDDAPTADVAPVVNGHWEHIAYDKYRCSVCKRETTVDTWLGEPLYKGCPYCFAIMDEKDGETDGKKL